MKHRMQGVTLIELMVVVAVLAIIASIAVPSYRSYLRRAQRADATAELLRVRTAQEKFFLQNGRYGTLAEIRINAVSEHGYYTIDLPVRTNVLFTARARATAGQLEDTPCQTFTITEAGVRDSLPGAITTCWK